MTIKVEQYDINTGVAGSRCGCPIALALKRMGAKDAAVSGISITAFGQTVASPSKAADFVSKFDAGQFVSPFALELAIA